MDSARALLDELMGKERDVPAELKSNKERSYDDDQVILRTPCCCTVQEDLVTPDDQRSQQRLRVCLFVSLLQVCKYEICGLCPYSLFKNTRSDLGKCKYEEHGDERIKEKWDALTEEERVK